MCNKQSLSLIHFPIGYSDCAHTGMWGGSISLRRSTAHHYMSNVKFELYMTASQFDGMAHNLQWLDGKAPYK
jgi:hypothetical protein